MAKRVEMYEYECGGGHYMASAKPMSKCLITRCKDPELKRIGQGSRTKEDPDEGG